MLRTIDAGSPVCVTVAHIDGFVLARSAFHHSVNYRSVMAFGTAHKLTDEAEVMEALRDFTERLYPGRWDGLRPVQPQELKATTVLAMDLTEAVAKVRAGMPIDDDEDYALPIWAGVLPVQTTVLAPVSDPRNLPGLEAPVIACRSRSREGRRRHGRVRAARDLSCGDAAPTSAAHDGSAARRAARLLAPEQRHSRQPAARAA